MNHSLQLKRILTEKKDIEEHPSKIFWAQPIEENIFVWHFTIKGPKDSVF